MRNAFSSFLLSRISCSRLFSRNAIFFLPSNQSAPSFHPKYSPDARNYFFSTLYPKLGHNLPTEPEKFLSFSSTTEELMASFKAFEDSVSKNDKKLGEICLKVGEVLLSKAPKDLEKALSFVVRALEILEKYDGGASLPLVKALRLVGSISCKMNKLDDSLNSLEVACQILGSLEEEGFCGIEFDSEKVSIHLELANTKNAMGRRWEALIDLQRSLQMRMLILEPDSLELALACKDVAEAYAGVLKFNEARPLCLKALEIFEAKIGKKCEDAIQVRQLLGTIYVGLEKNEEALVQNELCRGILLSLNMEAEILNMEIEAANIQINLGRLGEAMSTLKGVIQKAEKESEIRAFAFVSMAKIMYFQERFEDSKGCLNMTCDILNKVGSASSEKITDALLEISMLYEMMNEFETAIDLMKRTLSSIEKNPQEQSMMGSIFARMGWLFLLTGNVQQAVPSLENAISKLKNSFGPKHFGLGFAYKHLGQAYLEINKAQSAIQMLLLAKDIIEASFGPQHEDSIDTCQCIANAYGIMGNYNLAMGFQLEVVNRWEAQCPDAKMEFREACRLLHQLKKKTEGSPSAVFPANSLPESLQKRS